MLQRRTFVRTGIACHLFLSAGLSCAADSLYGHLVDHRPLSGHEIQNCSCQREEGSDGKRHFIHVPQNVDADPDLESDGKKACDYAYSGLKEECLETCC